jgi:hypothetical protein
MIRLLVAVAAVTLGLALIPTKPADRPPRDDPKKPTLDIALEVQALRTLYLLRVTPEQIKSLQKLAKEVATPDRKRASPNVSDDYRRVLVSLREALAADSEDKVNELEDRLIEATEAEEPELDDAVRVTAKARRRVPEVFRLLRPPQLASYFGSAAEEIGDPQERLVAALDQIRSAEEEEWGQTRDELAEDLGWLLGGLDSEQNKAVRAQVVALLDKARELTPAEFKKQRADLVKEARAVGADVAATDVLRHGVERALAQLLSNPRLAEALQARLK